MVETRGIVGKSWYCVDFGPVWSRRKYSEYPPENLKTFTGKMTFWVCSGCHCVNVLVRDLSSSVMVSGCFVRVLVCVCVVDHISRGLRECGGERKAILAVTKHSLGQRLWSTSGAESEEIT